MLCEAAAGADPVLLEEAGTCWNLTPHTSYVADPERAFTAEALARPVPAAVFTPLEARSVNFGVKDTSCWFRFTLWNTAPHPRSLAIELDNPRLNLTELYAPGEGGLEVQRAGTFAALAGLAPRLNRPVFHVELPGNTERTFLLRVDNRGALRFDLRAWDHHAFEAHQSRRLILVGLLIGGLFALSVHSAVQGIILADRSALYHSGFVATLLLFEVTVQGVGFQYMWPRAMWWADRSVVSFVGLAVAAGLGFSRVFLDTRAVAPRWDRVLLAFFGFFLLAALVNLTGWVWVNSAVHAVAVPAIVVVVTLAVRCSYLGHRHARFFLAAWGAMLAGAFVYCLMGAGLLPKASLTEHSVHLGVAIAPILFSIAVADRLRRVETRYKEDLEHQVRERTCELQDALKNVKTLRGLIPVCSRCKKMRDPRGNWNHMEAYIREHSEARLSHGLCPTCVNDLYGKERGDRVGESVSGPVA